MEHAAWTKEDIVDVLNVGVEELIRLRYELPKFDHLLRLSYQARKNTNAGIYTTIYDVIPEPTRNQLEDLLTVDPETNRSQWNLLHQDSGKVTIKEIDKVIERLKWIRSLDFPFDPFSYVPYVKFRHFAMEGGKKLQCQPYWCSCPAEAISIAGLNGEISPGSHH